MRRLLFLPLLMACSYDPEDFVDDLNESLCAQSVDCGNYDSVDDCLESTILGEYNEDCEFDQGNAKDCIDNYPTTCGEFEPSECTKAFDC